MKGQTIVQAMCVLGSVTTALHLSPPPRAPIGQSRAGAPAASLITRTSSKPALLMAAEAASALDKLSDGSVEPQPSWVQRLNKISTFASVLCAIDCTVFPVLLALLPLVNLAGPASSAWIHRAAHAVALYFVAPVGGAAVVSNAVQHRRPLLLGWGLSGVALVLLANLHLHFLPHAIEHFLHERHTIINVFGCALLLSSQWVSHRVLVAMGKCCGQDHGARDALTTPATA